jgi:hypothetical protein
MFVCECVRAKARACPSTRVFLVIQHETRRHVVICDIFGSTIFFDIIS